MQVHDEVLKKLEELLEVVKDLPQGYQYKVRELSACIETVVSMYVDVQRGIIPEVLIKMREGTLDANEESLVEKEPEQIVEEPIVSTEVHPEPDVPVEAPKTKLSIGNISL